MTTLSTSVLTASPARDCGPGPGLRALSRLTDRLLASQLIISLCAPALAFETALIAGAPLRPAGFYIFLFLATLTSYRVHAHVSRALREGTQRQSRGPALLTVCAGLAGLALSFNLGLQAWGLMGVCALLACLYSVPVRPGARRLRDYGMVKIMVLAGVWTLVTAAVPLLQAVDATTLALLIIRRFLFMLALCVAFDVRDLNADADSGVRTVAVRLGAERSYVLIRILLAAFVLMSLLFPVGRLPPLASGVTAGLVVSALLTWLVVEGTRRHRSNVLYLAGVDGMMLTQSLLVMAGTRLFHP